MEINLVSGDITKAEVDALIVNLFEGLKQPGGATHAVDKALNGAISNLITEGELKGELNQVAVIHTFGRISARRVIVVGLGKEEEFTLDRVRQVTATGLRKARDLGAKRVGTILHGAGVAGFDPGIASGALVEGAILGLYKFDRYTKREESKVEELLLIEIDEGKIRRMAEGVERGRILAEAQNLTRELVNEPGNNMTPSILTERAGEVASLYGLRIDVLERQDLERLGAKAFLAVAQGSDEPCKLIVLRYEPPDVEEKVALVGKGITFDTGGISLKRPEKMDEMKGDMAGGAAVIGAMQAIARLKPKLGVFGIVPAAENMPGGHALRPGDVIGSLSGKTIEVISTDAEGRLILADALSYARKLGAGRMIDMATLTTGCIVALGKITAAILGTNQELIDLALEVSHQTGERMWQLPLFDEYFEKIKSDIADMKNSGGREASAITASIFLKQFVQDTPWVHIDIAGKEFADEEKGYLVKGATGFGTRSLVEIVMRMRKGRGTRS
ncbi:MAG TPA: leucyl aminopeptidase [Candidatus Latescibacteria bacterium]|nr:leucyl aminopeptidase [Candidatus Latescibacterota bacterium]